MRAGVLNKLVSIEIMKRTSNGMGGHAVTWETWAENVWAAIWPLKAKEVIQAAKDGLVVTHRIKVRHRRLTKADMRINHRGTYYNLVSIINLNSANRELEFIAKEAA